MEEGKARFGLRPSLVPAGRHSVVIRPAAVISPFGTSLVIGPSAVISHWTLDLGLWTLHF